MAAEISYAKDYRLGMDRRQLEKLLPRDDTLEEEKKEAPEAIQLVEFASDRRSR
jgi:hypothetical protein